MLHAEAKHPQLRVQVDGLVAATEKSRSDVAAWFGSLPAVPAACKGSELLSAEGYRDQRFRSVRQDRLLEKTPQAEGGKFVPYSRWTQELHCDHGRALS